MSQRTYVGWAPAGMTIALVKVLSDMLETFFENSGEVRSSVASQEMI